MPKIATRILVLRLITAVCLAPVEFPALAAFIMAYFRLTGEFL
jgi:hypothetical protein